VYLFLLLYENNKNQIFLIRNNKILRDEIEKKNKKIAIKKVLIKFDIKTKSNQMLRDETKNYISIQK
jgi:hypothetical protein